MPEPNAADAGEQTTDPRTADLNSADVTTSDARPGDEQASGRTAAVQTRHADPRPTLLMVTGPGRSGTSAVTGALSQLGIHIPPPLVEWNHSNERGFFETRWVVDFQRKVLNKAHTYEFDADPRAIDRIAEVADLKTRQQLNDWLKDATDGRAQSVIKDPRSVWLHDLWTDAAEANGLHMSYLTMLRHPTEVVGSRSTYYGTAGDERKARDYAISKVAGWINVSLLNERQTRGARRVYLRYTDLLADWRTALAKVRDGIDLEFNATLAAGEPNPVDDFISPELHRIRTSWDELDVPVELQRLADDVWAACERLADEGGDADLGATFDALTEQYDRLYRDAAAISRDTVRWSVASATAEARRATKKELNRKLAETRDELAQAKQQVAKLTASNKRLEEAERSRNAQKGWTKTPPAAIRRAVKLGRRTIRRVRRRLGR